MSADNSTSAGQILPIGKGFGYNAPLKGVTLSKAVSLLPYRFNWFQETGFASPELPRSWVVKGELLLPIIAEEL